MVCTTLFLDLDDCLFDEMASAQRIFRTLCELVARRAGLSEDAVFSRFNQIRRERWAETRFHDPVRRYGPASTTMMWADFPDQPGLKGELRAFLPGFRRRVWEETLADFGISDPDLTSDLAEGFPVQYREAMKCFDDVEPTLTKLTQQYRCVILSDGFEHVQKEKISRCGLKDRFGEMFFSERTGAKKPNRATFEYVLRHLNLLPEEVVMVGDSQARDVAGAFAAGIRSVWLNRSASPRQESLPTPDATISSFEQLPEALLDF